MTQIRFALTAALSAYASYLAVHHTTPIDRALPFIAVIVVVCAFVSHEAVVAGVPVLIAIEICVADEGLRLLLFGVVLSAVVVIGVRWQSRRSWIETSGFAAALLYLLRWIPRPEHLGRELFLLALGVLIVLVLGRTPFATMVAVLTVLVTPAVPLRTLALPLAVLGVAILARIFGMPRIKLMMPSAIVLSFVTLFFAWSGVVARAFPYFLRRATPQVARTVIAQALPPGKSETWDVPWDAKWLVVSAANVATLRRGAILGRVNDVPVRVGDASDWGFMRRDVFYGAHNPLPRDPAGKLRDYGYAAWVDGAGRIALPRDARVIRVTADASLPADASLQVEGFE